MRLMRVHEAVQLIQAEHERTPDLRVTFSRRNISAPVERVMSERALTTLSPPNYRAGV
jgi:hypothetical protein